METARLQLVPLTTRFASEYDERECRTAEAHWSEHGFGHWALLDRRTGEFIGSAEVHFAYPGVEGISIDEIEIGIEILPPHQRQGFATEAVTAAVADTWRRACVRLLVAYTRSDHTASVKLMAKLGFSFRNFGKSRDGERISIYALPRRD